ncbi:hypothetical protein GT354_19440, partial [Streptomyces sp. SID3343]|nr:hypothetical protein [Streptomyces sp. SID3343]
MGSGGAGDGARQGPNGEVPGPSPFGPLELPRDETEVLPRFDEYGGYEGQEPHQPHQPYQPQQPYGQPHTPNPQYAPQPAPPG